MNNSQNQSILDLNSIIEIIQQRLHELGQSNSSGPELAAFSSLLVDVDGTKASLQPAL